MPWNWCSAPWEGNWRIHGGQKLFHPTASGEEESCGLQASCRLPQNKPQIPVIDPCVAPGSLPKLRLHLPMVFFVPFKQPFLAFRCSHFY